MGLPGFLVRTLGTLSAVGTSAVAISCSHNPPSRELLRPDPRPVVCSIPQPASSSAPSSPTIPGQLDPSDFAEPARVVHVPSAMDAVWFVARQSSPRGVETLCVSATIERSRRPPIYLRFRSFGPVDATPLETLEIDVQGGEVMVRGAGPDFVRHLSFRVLGWIRAPESDLAMTSPLASWRRQSMDARDCGRPSFWVAQSNETFSFDPPVQLVGPSWSVRLDTWFARRATCLARSRALP